MRAWLGEPAAGPALEFEALVKVFLAEHATKSELVVNLTRIAEEPGRALQAALNQAILRWAEDSLEEVTGWPDDLRGAPPARGALEAVAELAPG